MPLLLRILDAQNAWRVLHSRAPLAWSEGLAADALAWAEEVAATGRLGMNADHQNLAWSGGERWRAARLVQAGERRAQRLLRGRGPPDLCAGRDAVREQLRVLLVVVNDDAEALERAQEAQLRPGRPQQQKHVA
jgi:hypothetical protein